jgi:hypothetical protein
MNIYFATEGQITQSPTVLVGPVVTEKIHLYYLMANFIAAISWLSCQL